MPHFKNLPVSDDDLTLRGRTDAGPGRKVIAGARCIKGGARLCPAKDMFQNCVKGYLRSGTGGIRYEEIC